MKQITQKELIKLIKEKQENATKMEESLRIRATKIGDLSSAKVCFGEARAYQDLICYLDSVEIVPEEKVEPYIKAIVGENYENCFAPNLKVSDKGCVENVDPLRNDRFREFEEIKEDGCSMKDIIDAKSIEFIRFYDNKEHFEVIIWCHCGFANGRKFTEETNATSYYKELVEWWKYWKQN